MKQSAPHQVESNHDLIVKADTPILGIASQFWEDERQNAAVICYRSMPARNNNGNVPHSRLDHVSRTC